jgi:multidrug resistance efflux pump
MRLPLLLFGLTVIGMAGSACNRSALGAGERMSAGQPEGFAAPGRIEGSSEPIEIGSGIDGVLEAVLVAEGDRVSAGQVLARVSCGDLSAAIFSADAAARATHMRLVILRKGTRREDVDQARARAAVALAMKNRSAQFYERMQQLWNADKVISADELDRAFRENEAAAANFEAAAAEARRAEAGPLAEEIAEAEALAERAKHHALELRRRHQKCDVKSPVTGTVLKKLLLPGEPVSTVFPRPIVTVANLEEWTVRAEVDEHDIDRVRERMAVVVTSPAWGTRAYRGVVKTVSQSMGRRRVRSGDPAEKSDRDVREVIIRLEGDTFVVGLRVDVRFQPGL